MNTIRHASTRLALALVIAIAMGGCTSLLPRSKNEVVSAWNSYDDAVKSLSAIVPYRATRDDVHAQGLDPRTNPAITMLHFGHVLQRFAAAALIKPADVDRGINDCLHAGKMCSGYAISVKKIASKRIGSFLLDTFNFKRTTITKGWSVEALLVFVDDRLVYELIGGQPTISEYEQKRNPLGPLQAWGDGAMRLLR